MERARTFPLSLLFLQTFLIAVCFASLRLLPSDSELRHSLHFGAYLKQLIVLTWAGTAAGAFIGGWWHKAREGTVIGFCLSLPAAAAWTWLLFVRHSTVT